MRIVNPDGTFTDPGRLKEFGGTLITDFADEAFARAAVTAKLPTIQANIEADWPGCTWVGGPEIVVLPDKLGGPPSYGWYGMIELAEDPDA